MCISQTGSSSCRFSCEQSKPRWWRRQQRVSKVKCEQYSDICIPTLHECMWPIFIFASATQVTPMCRRRRYSPIKPKESSFEGEESERREESNPELCVYTHVFIIIYAHNSDRWHVLWCLQVSRATSAPPVVLEDFVWMDHQNDITRVWSDDADGDSFICSCECLY